MTNYFSYPEPPEDCPVCEGTGKIPHHKYEDEETDCTYCDGTGTVTEDELAEYYKPEPAKSGE
ncbi:MAG: hypothetical protein PHS30_04735 [Bacteroidales bacterium]|nr:hypothetical protein [Bacteroidales bacterium]